METQAALTKSSGECVASELKNGIYFLCHETNKLMLTLIKLRDLKGRMSPLLFKQHNYLLLFQKIITAKGYH